MSDRGRVEKSNSRSLLLDRGELGHCEMMRVSCHTFVWPLIGSALLNFRERTIMTRYRNQALSDVGIRY